ncbi:Phosphatidylethanolamine-binding protein [Legionella pneumophila]|nr:Phosphatidylethanolamine-binding protein [Legionella pneumophila]
MSLLLTSPAFEHNDFIPDEFTCHGLDRPPPLAWENAPPNTKSFVIIMDDPDALGGLWVHWVLFNIPANYNELDAAIDLPDSAVSVKNSWGKTGYGGPCPLEEHIDIFLGYMLWISFYL